MARGELGVSGKLSIIFDGFFFGESRRIVIFVEV